MGGLNVAETLAGTGYPTGARPASVSYAVPSAAPTSSGVSPGSIHATAQNGGVGPGVRAAMESGGGPQITRGSIVPGEPFTDPTIRGGLWDMWKRSGYGGPGAHEEGMTSIASFRNGQRVFSDPQSWAPSVTVEEAIRTHVVPTATRPPVSGTSMPQYVYGHVHPWDAGTVISSTAGGKPIQAAEGPSGGDVNANRLERLMGRNAMDYVVTPRGVYRILGSENVQWIAPLDYLRPGG